MHVISFLIFKTFLFQNICPVSQIDKDALEKLISVRNSVYAHAGDAKLSEKDFDSYWNLLEGEIFSLLQGCADVDFEHSIRQSVSKVCTVKPVLSGHSKITQKNVFQYRLSLIAGQK